VSAGSAERLAALLCVMPDAMNEVSPGIGAPIHVAAETNSKACMRVLLDYKANAGVEKLEDGASAIYLACANSAKVVLQMLVDEGFNVNQARKLDQASPVHAAATQANAHCLQMLLAARADPNAARSDGATAAHLAAEVNASENLRHLIHAKADVNCAMVRKTVGATPLHMACTGGHSVCVGILLQYQADPNRTLDLEFPWYGQTPLLLCAEHSQKVCLGKLLEAKADPEVARRSDGYCAVHVAAQKDAPAVVKLLLDAKCQVNAPAADGMSPMCVAARQGTLPCLKLLIAAKGEVNLQSLTGWGPLDYAEMHGNSHIDSILHEHGGRAQRPPSPSGGRLGTKRGSGPMEFVPGKGMVPVERKGIRVCIVNARGLRLSDISGLSDPYVVCEINFRKGGHRKFQTKVVKGSLNPDWGHDEHVPEFLEGDSFKFEVWDKDNFMKGDDFLGACRLRSEEFFPNGWEGDLMLSKSRDAKGKGQGTLRIRVAVPY